MIIFIIILTVSMETVMQKRLSKDIRFTGWWARAPHPSRLPVVDDPCKQQAGSGGSSLSITRSVCSNAAALVSAECILINQYEPLIIQDLG
jgi:hypothetical protein